MFYTRLPIFLIVFHFCNSFSEIHCPYACNCTHNYYGFSRSDIIECSSDVPTGILSNIEQYLFSINDGLYQNEKRIDMLEIKCGNVHFWRHYLYGSTLNLYFVRKVIFHSCSIPGASNRNSTRLLDVFNQVGLDLKSLRYVIIENIQSVIQILDIQQFKYTVIFQISHSKPQLLKLDFLADHHTPQNETREMHRNPTETSTVSHIRIFSLVNNSLTGDMYIDVVCHRIMQYFPNLAKFDMAYNKFTTLKALNSETFSRFPAQISLDNNNITHLDRSIEYFLLRANHFRKQVTIYLRENPLDCGCSLYTFLPYFTIGNGQRINVDKTYCHTPKEMYGIELSKINPETFTCSVINSNLKYGDPCAEKGICNCYLRPHDESLIIDCSSRQLSALPDLTYIIDYDYIELNMENNLLQEVVIKNTSINYANVTILKLGMNNIERIEVDPMVKNLKSIELHRNQLTALDKKFLDYLSRLQLSKISFHDNPWLCNCGAMNLLSLIKKQNSIIYDVKNIRCQITNDKLIAMTEEILCPDTHLSLIIGTLIAFLGFLIGSLAALYYRFRREIQAWMFSKNICLSCLRKEDPDNDKIYDVFISYSHKDEDFVVQKLMAKLEGDKNPYKVCVHFRDWIPGEYIPTQIIRSVQESKRTILVISPHFIQSIWGKLEFQTAHTQALSENKTRVIPIMYGKIESLDELDADLQVYLKMHTFIEWGDSWFWEKLKYALHHGRCTKNKTNKIV